MMFATFNAQDALHSALRALNWSYGTGDIVRISSTHYFVKRQFGTAKYRYTVDGDTVHARGHQRAINAP